MPWMCPRDKKIWDLGKGHANSSPTSILYSQRAALTLNCFGTGRQSGGWRKGDRQARELTPNFLVCEQLREGLKKQQAQFRVSTLSLPGSGAHSEKLSQGGEDQVTIAHSHFGLGWTG